MIVWNEAGQRTQIPDKCWAMLTDKQKAKYSFNEDGTDSPKELLVEEIVKNAPTLQKKSLVQVVGENEVKPKVKRIVKRRKK